LPGSLSLAPVPAARPHPPRRSRPWRAARPRRPGALAPALALPGELSSPGHGARPWCSSRPRPRAARPPSRCGTPTSPGLGAAGLGATRARRLSARRARPPGVPPRPGARPCPAQLPALAPGAQPPAPARRGPYAARPRLGVASAHAAAVPLCGVAPCPLLGPDVCATCSRCVSAALRTRVLTWCARLAVLSARRVAPCRVRDVPV
jgi:hypothetical protein